MKEFFASIMLVLFGATAIAAPHHVYYAEGTAGVPAGKGFAVGLVDPLVKNVYTNVWYHNQYYTSKASESNIRYFNHN